MCVKHAHAEIWIEGGQYTYANKAHSYVFWLTKPKKRKDAGKFLIARNQE